VTGYLQTKLEVKSDVSKMIDDIKISISRLFEVTICDLKNKRIYNGKRSINVGKRCDSTGIAGYKKTYIVHTMKAFVEMRRLIVNYAALFELYKIEGEGEWLWHGILQSRKPLKSFRKTSKVKL
jgi:hypothetical protein